MDIKQLRQTYADAYKAAQAALTSDEFNEEEAQGLVDKAKGLKGRLDALEALTPPADAKPAPSGITVVADETDKKAVAKTWGLGEFCIAVARDSIDVRPFKSGDPGFYDVGKAVGPKLVSSITQAKAIRQKAISGMSETVPADGGFLVGTQDNYAIMSKVFDEGQIIQRVAMTPLSGNSNGATFRAVLESSRADGSRNGGVQYYWLSEGSEKTSSDLEFHKIELKLNKLAALVYATDELLEDATALESEIMRVAPRELRFGVEESFYNGTGAGQPLGILNAPCLVTQAAEAGQAAATIVSENVINMWSRRWPGASGYVWMINPDCWPQLMQMNLGVGTGGALTFMPPGGLSSASYASLFGAPILENEHCQTLGTTGDIALCAWSEYQAVEKGSVQSASSIHVRFIYDETVFRFVYRVDGQPNAKWPLPLTPYNSTVTQGPFVVLATRS